MRDQCSDDDLVAAVRGARSWRGVLRLLNLPDQSAYRLRAVREHAHRLGCDDSHFTGQRRWSEQDLRRAVEDATDWYDVLRRLGLSDSGGGSLSYVRLCATRLRLDVTHLRRLATPPTTSWFSASPDPAHLRTAGSMLAASWFAVRGYTVTWPLEPCRYDLLVEADLSHWRIQVKTTTNELTVMFQCSRRHGSRLYRLDEIDAFFVLDSSLSAYLLPFAVVAGLTEIGLRKYDAYRVGTAGNWLETPPAA